MSATAGAGREDVASKLDEAWGDPAAWSINGLQWTHHPRVRARIHRRVTGREDRDALQWFFEQVSEQQPLPLGRVLVIGCGTGRTEREVLRLRAAAEVLAFDLSSRALEVARREMAGDPAIRYVQADMDRLPLGEDGFEPGAYDAVIGVSSVHHCGDLGSLFDAVARLLKPRGWLFLDEYVGPDRFQFPATQMRLIQAASDLLPPALLTTSAGARREAFRAPTIEEVTTIDPTEAACSSRIVAEVRARFDLEHLRPYGGGLLQMLLADVTQNFQSAADADRVECLLDAEEAFGRQGLLHDDFACLVARAKAR